MTRFLVNRIKFGSAVLILACTGCSGELKSMLIDQAIGFISSISAAGATSLIQQWFGAGTA